MALCLCAATAYFNHRAAEARAEAERQAEIARKAAEAETAAKEEKRIAAEKAAKQVARKWLIGAWVPVDGLSAKVRKDRSLYCAGQLL